jgi:hypothetical protein
MLIGALLRVPAQAIQRRIVTELNAAGFVELRVPHMAVLQYPGPDGVRPGLLAERAGMSKQAMNQLLRSLERSRLSRPVRRARRGPRARGPLYQARTRRIRKNPRRPPRRRTRMEHCARTETFCRAERIAAPRLGEPVGRRAGRNRPRHCPNSQTFGISPLPRDRLTVVSWHAPVIRLRPTFELDDRMVATWKLPFHRSSSCIARGASITIARRS